MKGRTCFVIVHRLSTICNTNFILIINNGKITEQGINEKLIGLKGLYNELYMNMMKMLSK